MIAALLMLAALLAAVCWLCASPVRLVIAGGVLLVTHPAPTLALTVLVAVGLSIGAGVLTYRSVRGGGWHLVTVCRPAFAPAGGVAR